MIYAVAYWVLTRPKYVISISDSDISLCRMLSFQTAHPPSLMTSFSSSWVSWIRNFVLYLLFVRVLAHFFIRFRVIPNPDKIRTKPGQIRTKQDKSSLILYSMFCLWVTRLNCH